jgi:hypothetical protein
MIPSTWRPHFRGIDGGLVGYLDGTDPAVTPRTVFGYALAQAGPTADAVRVLEARGLACLGERWELTLDSGEPVPVLIMSAYADRVVVVETEYGYYGPDSPRHTLTAPTGHRLTQPA